MRAWSKGLGVLALLLATGALASEPPRPRRMAVVVGSNSPATGRSTLRYAHDDARSVAEALVQVGDFAPEDVHVMLDPRPSALLAALDGRREALRGQPGETLLLFYYSGHADQQALYPGGQALPLEELRQRIDAPGATVRLGIIDACRGGGWTRAKGLQPDAPFEVALPLTLQSEGSVLISSSSGLENAHETEALQGSFFTHHLVAGLLGAADQGGDGEVSMVEAFTYARQLTLRDTALLGEGLQHPSFAMNLRGRTDLPLARVRTSASHVELRQTTGPMSVIRADSGLSVLELPAGKRTTRVALRPGKYLLVRKEPGLTRAREFTLDAGQRATLDEGSLEPVHALGPRRKGLDGGPRNTVTLSPVTFLRRGALSAEYERALGPNLTLFANPIFSSLTHSEGSGATGYVELGLGSRYFFFGGAPGGLYAGPELRGLAIWSSVEDAEGHLLGAAVGLNAGYTFLPWDWLVLSFGLTESYLWMSGRGPSGSGHSAGFVTSFRFHTGIAF